MTNSAIHLSEKLRGVFPRDGRWGHRIVFDDYEGQRIYGWLTPRVQVGDYFGYQLESGGVGIFRIVEVDRCLDPRDMFFGESEPIGYARNISLEELDNDPDSHPTYEADQ